MKTKSKKADLEGKKSLFFQAGLIIALSLALVAFEWPSSEFKGFDIPISQGVIEMPDDVIITRREEIKPPPPPPLLVVPEVLVIRENTFDIPDFDPDIFVQDTMVYLPTLIKEEDDVDEVIPFMLIEEKPTFMGGDYNSFTKWVAQRIVYPELAVTNGIQGRVTIQFMIDTDGTVKDITVIQSVDKMLAEEVLRVVSQSPTWSAGKQRGNPTKVLFTFPFTFRLK